MSRDPSHHDPDAPPSARRRGPLAAIGLDRPRIAALCFLAALLLGAVLAALWISRLPSAPAPAETPADAGGLPPPRATPLPAPAREVPDALRIEPAPEPAPLPGVAPEPDSPPPEPAAEEPWSDETWTRIDGDAALPVAPAPPPGSAVDRPALPREDASPSPRYPSGALRRREQGETLLAVEVDAGGGVRNVRILRSSGSRTLDNAARSAVRRWRFEPALRDGRAVADEVQIPVGFALD